MSGARVGLAVGLALSAIAVAIVLSGSPPVLAGTNGVIPVPYPPLASVPGGGRGCQADETVPAGSSAIRLSLEASAGPRVSVAVLSGGRTIAHGASVEGWLGRVVTVPVTPLERTVHNATVCFSFAGAKERVSLLGVRTSPRSATRMAPACCRDDRRRIRASGVVVVVVAGALGGPAHGPRPGLGRHLGRRDGGPPDGHGHRARVVADAAGGAMSRRTSARRGTDVGPARAVAPAPTRRG